MGLGPTVGGRTGEDISKCTKHVMIRKDARISHQCIMQVIVHVCRDTCNW